MPQAHRLDAEQHPDSVCLGCGCLCDDITAVVADGRVVAAEHACARGEAWFAASSEDASPECWIDGQPAAIDDGLDHAAAILRNARSPLVTGLDAVCVEAQRIAVAIADRIRGFVDAGGLGAHESSIHAALEVGSVGCTLGEIRHRADLVLAWFVDPVATHPRFFERYGVDAIGEFVPRGRADRRLCVIDEHETATAAQSDHLLLLKRDRRLAALWTVRAIVAGLSLDPHTVARLTGVSLEQWNTLARLLLDARYGVILHDAGAADAEASIESAAILHLVRVLSERTRFVAAALGSGNNAKGAEQVLLWSTGYPAAVDLRGAVPAYQPQEATTSRLLDRGEVDAVLSLEGRLALDSIETSAGCSIVALVEDDLDPVPNAQVVFRVARLGTHAGGTVFRSDGVPIPARAVLPSHAPAAQELIALLLDRLEHAPGAGDA